MFPAVVDLSGYGILDLNDFKNVFVSCYLGLN